MKQLLFFAVICFVALPAKSQVLIGETPEMVRFQINWYHPDFKLIEEGVTDDNFPMICYYSFGEPYRIISFYFINGVCRYQRYFFEAYHLPTLTEKMNRDFVPNGDNKWVTHDREYSYYLYIAGDDLVMQISNL